LKNLKLQNMYLRCRHRFRRTLRLQLDKVQDPSGLRTFIINLGACINHNRALRATCEDVCHCGKEVVPLALLARKIHSFMSGFLE